MKTLNLAHFFSWEGRTSSMLRSILLKLSFCALSLGMMLNAHAATIYVNGSAASGGDGSSWATAFNTIGAGLDAATAAENQAPGTQVDVWVAGGTYPMARCNYQLANNVNIYGGFAGTESQLSQRTFTGNVPTIQSALTEPDSGVNCYLFSLVGTTNTFNGITLIAIGGILQSGGTLTAVSDTFARGDPNIELATAVGGGGISAYKGATLTVDKSVFLNEEASIGGGVAGLNAASVTVTNSTFSGNTVWEASYWSTTINGTASISGGGAIAVDGNFHYDYYDYGSPVNNTKVAISGNTFINNNEYGPEGGGAISVHDSGVVNIANSTFGALDSNGLPISASANTANSGNTAASGNGGAISLGSNNQMVLSGDNFYGNVASSGGAIYSQGEDLNASVSITGSKFTGNRATYGGAIADAGELSNALKTVALTISSNTFNSNTASNGPAIFYDGSEKSIDGKTTTAAIDNALIKGNNNLLASAISP